MTDPSPEETVRCRCKLCGERFESLGAALDHWAAEHPDSNRLHEIVDTTQVKTNCVECGSEFVAQLKVSYEKGELARRAYCDSCGEASFAGINKLVVGPIAGSEAVRREAT